MKTALLRMFYMVPTLGLFACDTGKSERQQISGTGMLGSVLNSEDSNDDSSKDKDNDKDRDKGKGSGSSNGNNSQLGNQNPNGGGSAQGSGGVSPPNIPTPSAPAPSAPQPSPNPGPVTPLPPQPPAPKAVGLEECSAQKKAWPAVVNQKQPTQCGDALVDWCCTRSEIKARFPSLSATLEERFKKHVDTDQFVLYHCSYDPTGSPQKGPKYTFHLGRIVEPQVFYQPVHVYDLAPVTPASPQSPCPPPVVTNGLKKPATLPGPDFAGVIRPLIDAKCGGTNCHSAATTLGAKFDFSVPTNLKKANQAFLFSMPPSNSGKAPLTSTELKSLTDFMNAP